MNIYIKEYCIKNRLIIVLIFLFFQSVAIGSNDRYEIIQLTEVIINNESIVNFFRENVIPTAKENGCGEKNVYMETKFVGEDTIDIIMIPNEAEYYPSARSNKNQELYVAFIDGFRIYVEADRTCKLITLINNSIRYKFLRTLLIVDDSEYYWKLTLEANEIVVQYFQHGSTFYIRDMPDINKDRDTGKPKWLQEINHSTPVSAKPIEIETIH